MKFFGKKLYKILTVVLLSSAVSVVCRAEGRVETAPEAYDRLKQELEKTSDVGQRVAIQKKMQAIIQDLVGPQPILPIVAEIPHRDDASVMPEIDENIILKSKLDSVFQRFIDKRYLDDRSSVLALTMQRSFELKLDSINSAGVLPEVKKYLKSQIYVFVETARSLFVKVQVLSMSPAIIHSIFGSVPFSLVDKRQINDFFVRVLYTTFFDSADWLVAAKDITERNLDLSFIRSRAHDICVKPLISFLQDEKIIQYKRTFGCFGSRCETQKVKNIFDVLIVPDFDKTMLEVLDLEREIEAIPSLKAMQQDAFIKKFLVRIDELIVKLLQMNDGISASQRSGAASTVGLRHWIKLFVSKLVLLKKAMLIRIQVSRGGKFEKIRREVYVKCDVIMQNPLLIEMSTLASLRGYVSRFESLMTRFLTGDVDPIIDFYHDHQMLLIHMRDLLKKITPQGWRSYVYEVQGDGVYASVLGNMIATLEIIDKALQEDESLLGIAQGIVSKILSGSGKALDGAEIQLGATKLGLTPEQLKAAFSGNNTQDTLLKLLAQASPLLMSSLLQYLRGGATAPTQAAEQAKVTGVNTGHDASTGDLAAKVETKVLGLLAERMRHAVDSKDSVAAGA